MFIALKSLKEKYQNSSTWTELFLSYLPRMNDIYKRLGEAESDKERIKIYEELVQFQQKKIEDLANENQKLREWVKNQKEEVKRLKKEVGDDGLIKLLIKANEEADKLGTNINQTQVLIEAKK